MEKMLSIIRLRLRSAIYKLHEAEGKAQISKAKTSKENFAKCTRDASFSGDLTDSTIKVNIGEETKVQADSSNTQRTVDARKSLPGFAIGNCKYRGSPASALRPLGTDLMMSSGSRNDDSNKEKLNICQPVVSSGVGNTKINHDKLGMVESVFIDQTDCKIKGNEAKETKVEADSSKTERRTDAGKSLPAFTGDNFEIRIFSLPPRYLEKWLLRKEIDGLLRLLERLKRSATYKLQETKEQCWVTVFSIATGSLAASFISLFMTFGQHQVEKTILAKCLTGKASSATEASTEGIETDLSHFEISMEVWKTGQKGKEVDVDSKVFSHSHAAGLMIKRLKGEQEKMSGASGFKTSDESSRREQSEEDTAENTFETELPDDLVKLSIEMLLSDRTVERNDNIYSTLWDFGGQMVYNATHPIFMTDKAVYILTCDLSRGPYQHASILESIELYKIANDINFTDTNMDCLDFWLSSVYSLTSSKASSLDTALPEMSPTRLVPVFLVCTHADKPYTESPDEHPNAMKVALDIYRLFDRTKIYRNHLFQDVLVVDNTKSGSDNDCQEVIRLREESLLLPRNYLI